MKRLIALACFVALITCACSEDSNPTDGNPPANQSAHDTVAVHSPPSPGGQLDGIWKTDAFGWSYPCLLMQAGFRGIYEKLFWTDLRIDGSRVWFKADEPNGGYRHRFNGTLSGTTITGWIGTWAWTVTQGETRLIGYAPVTFTKQQ